MSHGKFVISLDFELFWGVRDTQTVGGYGRNVLGEWQAVPRMLELFRHHRINVTWATVGAVMCRDHAQWRSLRPEGDTRPEDDLVKEHPRLFFARPLVERILDTYGQELGTHTYSHFYCSGEGATPDRFLDDLRCARAISAEMGASFQTIVFPRNQIVKEFLAVLPAAGIRVYRGNAQHWLYRNGNAVPGGRAGRIVRYVDAFVPLSGSGCRHEQVEDGLVNVPASMFLYAWSPVVQPLAVLRLRRIKQGMTAAARTGAVFHLWWHPHNFGVNLELNLAILAEVLRHYRVLADKYGMQSQCMGEFAGMANARPAAPRPHRVPDADTPAPALFERSAP